MDDLGFYRPGHPWGEFSNFAPYAIEINGAVWPTSEHYFQAQKFRGTSWEESVRLCASPFEAAEIGRRRDLPLRDEWENVKVDVMRRALRAKFEQHPELQRLLESTGDRRLVERARDDSYWGEGPHGTGRNMLGLLLIELRTSFRIKL